eukprot:Cvel_33767.t1-p1 / transcript=Cvel_33767.t1 / gene=Cvel_33767 / organism=Chromera_velia_CCMP2878 / gene_product=hypothetical protein / transcript_product=hypothetical protein / location=Cvel_scaffold5585:966-4878(-) / protein_length=82 / sequence_SO=supercontig / SO=protein_coding / is_pseudo=false
MESGGGVSKWKGVPIPILASPGKRQKVRSSEKKRESSLSPQPAVYRREGRENGVGVNCAESVVGLIWEMFVLGPRLASTLLE